MSGALRDEAALGVLLAAPSPHGENCFVIGCSAGAARMLGAALPCVLGCPLDALFGDVELGLAVARAAARGQRAEFEGALARVDAHGSIGSVGTGEAAARVLVATGGLCGSRVASVVAIVENDEDLQEGGEGATARDAGRPLFGRVQQLMAGDDDTAPDPDDWRGSHVAVCSLLRLVDESWAEHSMPQHYRDIAQHSGLAAAEHVAMCICSPVPDYPILYASRNFRALFGYPLSALLGQNARMLQTPGAPRQGLSNATAALGACRSFACVAANSTRGSSPVLNLLTVEPVLRRGVPVVFVGWQMDIGGNDCGSARELLPPGLLGGGCLVESAPGTRLCIPLQHAPQRPPPVVPPPAGPTSVQASDITVKESPATVPQRDRAGMDLPGSVVESAISREASRQTVSHDGGKRRSVGFTPDPMPSREGTAASTSRAPAPLALDEGDLGSLATPASGNTNHLLPKTDQRAASTSPDRGIQKQVLRTLELTELEVQQYERMFRTFDKDGSGTIDTDELREVMNCLGVRVSDDELRELQMTVDTNNSGEIEFDEFLVLMKQYKESCRFRVLNKNEFAAQHIRSATRSKKVLPDAPWKWGWDGTLMLVTLYWTITVLYRDARRFPMWPWRLTVEWLLSAFLVSDIALTFNTARPHPRRQSTVETTRELALLYLASWHLPCDLLAAVPLDLLLHAAGYEQGAQVVAHLRLLRLLRVQSLFRIMPRGTMPPAYVRFHFHYVPLFRSFFWWVIMVHVLTCVRLLQTDEDDQDYVHAIYWVLYTITSVGYGDIEVTTHFQRIFACLLFILGLIVNGIMIGKLTVAIQKGDVESERMERMRETLAIIEHFDVPEVLQEEILAFQYHILNNSLSTSYSEVIVGLPQTLKDNLGMYMRIKFISSVGLFAEAQEECKVALAQSLQNLLTAPEELILVAGDPADEMFFMAHGFADMISQSGRYMCTVRKGNNFGEEALATRVTSFRTYSVKALTYCELFVLANGDFLDILRRYPSFRMAVADEMEKRNQEWEEGREEAREDHIALSGSSPDRRRSTAHPFVTPGLAYEDYDGENDNDFMAGSGGSDPHSDESPDEIPLPIAVFTSPVLLQTEGMPDRVSAYRCTEPPTAMTPPRVDITPVAGALRADHSSFMPRVSAPARGLGGLPSALSPLPGRAPRLDMSPGADNYFKDIMSDNTSRVSSVCSADGQLTGNLGPSLQQQRDSAQRRSSPARQNRRVRSANSRRARFNPSLLLSRRATRRVANSVAAELRRALRRDLEPLVLRLEAAAELLQQERQRSGPLSPVSPGPGLDKPSLFKTSKRISLGARAAGAFASSLRVTGRYAAAEEAAEQRLNSPNSRVDTRESTRRSSLSSRRNSAILGGVGEFPQAQGGTTALAGGPTAIVRVVREETIRGPEELPHGSFAGAQWKAYRGAQQQRAARTAEPQGLGRTTTVPISMLSPRQRGGPRENAAGVMSPAAAPARSPQRGAERPAASERAAFSDAPPKSQLEQILRIHGS
eukprot:TRINITY_DN24377_c0_g1_i1.p1 TRINITY_DN24377_c0_g1~~TRINITY_DN24377_c0_g1_i1.p1  ORF type:complete len:1536 (+),score=449.81 TRINITY_DN24377_c0_g1_i1:100-4608(+)